MYPVSSPDVSLYPTATLSIEDKVWELLMRMKLGQLISTIGHTSTSSCNLSVTV